MLEKLIQPIYTTVPPIFDYEIPDRVCCGALLLFCAGALGAAVYTLHKHRKLNEQETQKFERAKQALDKIRRKALKEKLPWEEVEKLMKTHEDVREYYGLWEHAKWLSQLDKHKKPPQ